MQIWMNRVKILHIGDMQNGFITKTGNLYVHDSEYLIKKTNTFLKQIKNSDFDYIFIVLDTHFVEEYHLSEEGKQFPIHCEYGSSDWNLSIDIPEFTQKYYLLKNRFDMWGYNDSVDIHISSPSKRDTYDSLFYLIDDPVHPKLRIERDKLISSLSDNITEIGIEVTMIGVASDFCIRYAMEGWLERNARVTIISDLTKGIGKEINQVLKEGKYCYFPREKLRSISCKEYLKELSEKDL